MQVDAARHHMHAIGIHLMVGFGLKIAAVLDFSNPPVLHDYGTTINPSLRRENVTIVDLSKHVEISSLNFAVILIANIMIFSEEQELNTLFSYYLHYFSMKSTFSPRLRVILRLDWRQWQSALRS